MARMEDGVETTSWFSPGTRIVKCLLRLGWLRARNNPQLGAVYEKNHTRLFRWKSGGGREAKDEVEFGVWSSVESQESQDSNGHDLQSIDPPWGSDGAIPTAGGPIRTHVCALTRGPKDPHGQDRLQRACLTTTWSAWDAVSFFY